MKELFWFAVVPMMFMLAAELACSQSDSPLIPRKVLFGNPDRAGVSISPDGSKISFLASVDGVLNVWVGPVDDPNAARPVTHDKKRGIHYYFWAHTNHHLLYLQDRDGDEDWHVYCVDIESLESRDLTPYEKVQARIQGISHLFPEEILIGLNDRNPRFHDIHRVNILTGADLLVFKNDSFMEIMADDRYALRLGFEFNPEGGMSAFRLSPEGKGEQLLAIRPEDVLTMQPVDFDQTGKILYLLDSRGRNTRALMAFDLESMELDLLAENTRADINGVMIHPTEKYPQGCSTNYQRQEWQALDEGVREDLERLRSVVDGDFGFTGRTLDDRVWIVAYTMDNGPVRYYKYDRESKEAVFLFTARRALEGLPLAPMHPLVIKARDGLELVSYLTLPIGAAAEGGLRPEKPLPLVLWVHGGPWSRDTWGYDPIHQWFANRGYAVLSVNFRGSTGFGKQFVNAANLEWGGKMHDDLIDAVEWAIREGIADPERVAIAGGSYGGYAALVGMTRSTDLFACGIDIVGISNLITWMNNLPEYWKPMLPVVKVRVGDIDTEEGRAFLVERCEAATDWVGGERVNLQDPAFRPDITFVA